MDEQVADLIARTLESRPENATHWSTRSMAKKTGLSQSTVSRVWRAFGLQPHRSETFKLSTDPFFVDKVHDVVGLCLDPPERALVLCVDEKSQIQALDRSQPVLPMMPGVPERATHDYVRAGTSTLFAAFDAASGKVIGSLHRRHRAEEFRKFLAKLDKELPREFDVHLICDSFATHKTAAVKRWLLSHPRFHMLRLLGCDPVAVRARRKSTRRLDLRGSVAGDRSRAGHGLRAHALPAVGPGADGEPERERSVEVRGMPVD